LSQIEGHNIFEYFFVHIITFYNILVNMYAEKELNNRKEFIYEYIIGGSKTLVRLTLFFDHVAGPFVAENVHNLFRSDYFRLSLRIGINVPFKANQEFLIKLLALGVTSLT
jgi:hypothetical protein